MRKFARWDSVLDKESSDEVIFHLSGWHLSLCDEGKQVDDIKALLRERDCHGLCHYDLSYDSVSIETYRHLRQILAFFQKRKDVDLGIDTRDAAWVKAVAAERLCAETNEIFRRYNAGGFKFHPRVESVLYRAQCKISTILGDLPSLSELKVQFGPGATTQVKKKDASARRKLSQKFACSEEMMALFPELASEAPDWFGVNPLDSSSLLPPVLTHVGKVAFVPKSAKTDRTITVEPSLNSFVQLGVGRHIADRLRLVGVDIQDQSLNQRLAMEGSITGALATLDLSSASDTIASGLVESLLPLDWWIFLRTIRTGRNETPDGIMKLDKFSSMGNGFTFPLETLIFFSLALACSEGHKGKVSVYGDDIIVPTAAVPLLLEVLHSCGFIVNQGKSFISGPFRESCGKDYYSGIDVRPVYIKDVLTVDQIFILHNHYARRFDAVPASYLRSLLDPAMVLEGPDGYGDGHLVVMTEDYPRVYPKRDRGWSGFTFETYTWKTRKGYYKLYGDYVFPSYSIYVRESPDLGEFAEIKTASRFLRRRSRRTGDFPHGLIRPTLGDSRYVKYEGRTFLEDTLPGVDGYKRIKIYVLA